MSYRTYADTSTGAACQVKGFRAKQTRPEPEARQSRHTASSIAKVQ